jgi:hypothetical protein
MAEPPVCLECGMPDPPPEQTCTSGMDHFVGTEQGCLHCGRLVAACVLRPCSARRQPAGEGGDDG